MKYQIAQPMLASREFAALPCVTAIPATVDRGIALRGVARDVRGTDTRRTRIPGTHTGFAHSAGSLTWSPPI